MQRPTPPLLAGFVLLAAATTAGAGDPPDPCPAGSPLIRLTSACYADGIKAPRTLSVAGGELPGARLISNLICAQGTTDMPDSGGLSAMVFQWGQFIDHDITLIPTSEGTSGQEDFPIPIPEDDPDFATSEMPFQRSTGIGGVTTPREQTNAITAYLDGSAVYGSDPERNTTLRKHSRGQLKTSAGPDGDLLPYNTTGLDNANQNPGLDPGDLFAAGDVRANEQVALTTMHTLWVREHNRLAELILTGDFPGSDPEDPVVDELVYHEARRWVAALLQSITYYEFLPVMLGPAPLPPYAGYDAAIDPCISNEFSSSAYRVGHSMLPSTLERYDGAGAPLPAGHLALSEAFFRPDQVSDFGIAPYLRGLAFSPMQEIDCFVVDDVRNFLFGPPDAGGLDLAALNIQRGRDHGIPGYNEVRRALGFPAAVTFADITSDPVLQDQLSAAYNGELEDVDLWIGGGVEDHLPGAHLGELFHHLWIEQFQRLRDGDPCWFENAASPTPFTATEMIEIRSTTLSEVIARNTEFSDPAASVFHVPGSYTPQPIAITHFGFDPASRQVTITWKSSASVLYEVRASSDFGTTTPFATVHSTAGTNAANTTTATFTDERSSGAPSRGYLIVQPR